MNALIIYIFLVKPVIDFIVSLLGLFLISPIFVIITIVLTITTQGHPFFIQPRPGKNGNVFKIIKFRTMNKKCNRYGFLLPDEERITRFGKFLRKTSLDEIPQLLNVLKGDISLIGPRPLLVQYLPLYNDFQKRRHEVRPGITGWAQVNGRNAISWQQKFEYDIWYVEHISFILDLKIVCLTIKKIFIMEGINSVNSATMEPFTGSN